MIGPSPVGFKVTEIEAGIGTVSMAFLDEVARHAAGHVADPRPSPGTVRLRSRKTIGGRKLPRRDAFSMPTAVLRPGW
jgi:hypothetical protein